MKKIERREFIKYSLAVLAGIGAVYVEANAIMNAPIISNYLEDFLSSETLKEKEIEDKYNIRVIGDTTSTNISLLDKLLGYTSLTLDKFWPQMKLVKYISIKKTHDFTYNWDETTKTIGVELYEDYFFPQSIVHELAHAHFGSLKAKSELIKDWEQTITPSYYKALREKEAEYSEDSPTEDIASIADDAYWMRLHLLNGGSPVDLLTTVIPTHFYEARSIIGEDKMARKMALLKDYAFMSPREYEIMEPLVRLKI